MKKCTHVNCDLPFLAKGYCRFHYDRMWKGKDLDGPRVHGAPMKFISSIAQTNDCVVWPYGKDNSGYGRIRSALKGRAENLGAHRVSLWTHAGPPPSPSHFACHLCNNPPCVNPRHLYWGTGVDNRSDSVAAGTAAVGVRNSSARLTEDQVREIRASTEHRSVLSERYGIHTSCIDKVRYKRSWKHVK